MTFSGSGPGQWRPSHLVLPASSAALIERGFSGRPEATALPSRDVSRIKPPHCCILPWLGQLSRVLARRHTFCLRHQHRYHVGQVDEHAILIGLAVIPRMGQYQTAPLIQRQGDRLKRLAFPGKSLDATETSSPC